MADTSNETVKSEAPKAPPLTATQQRALDIKEGKIKPYTTKAPVKPTEPMFHITPSITAVRKELTPAQRRSSLFAEAPRIGATVLRRGMTLKMNEDQFEANEIALKRLHSAGAIEISRVLPNGKIINFRDEELKEAAEKKEDIKQEKLENIKKQASEQRTDGSKEAPKGKPKKEKKKKDGKQTSEDDDEDMDKTPVVPPVTPEASTTPASTETTPPAEGTTPPEGQ